MKTILLPSQEYLLDCFENIGPHLIWLERPVEHFHTYAKFERFNRDFAGTIAGTRSKTKRYINVQLDTKMYLAHRLVYKIHTGIDPNILDHINNVQHDNRFENLRNGTQATNMLNKRLYKNNKSGHPNIYDTKYGWLVKDWINKKSVTVGTYPTLEEAIQAKKEWDEA